MSLAHEVTVSTHQSLNSFCVWGDIHKTDIEEKDPNYLLEEMFEKNQFHLALHSWAEKNKHLPLLHVDIHGKSDQEVCQIDIGIKSIEEHWGKEDPLIDHLTKYFKEFAQIFEGSDIEGCEFNMHGDFEGCWKKYKKWKPDRHSMTEQAIELGIPSLQMELPRKVRKELFSNPALLKKFSSGFAHLY